MKMRIAYASLPLALLLSAGANAQVLQDQGIVTERPLQLTQGEQTTVYRTIVRESVAPQTRPAKRSKQIVRKNGKVVRTTTTEQVVTRPAPVRQQAIIDAPRAPVIVTADPLDLSPDQRNVVYRTLVQQPVAPAPVVTQRIVPAPGTRPFVTSEPDTVVTTVPSVPGTTGAATTVIEPAPVAEIAIGSRLPASVPLYVMPAETAAAVPAMEGYRYALIGDRVYLVDPRDGIVVAMLYQ